MRLKKARLCLQHIASIVIISAFAATFSSCREDDKTPPEIILKGTDKMELLQYEAYEEPGYSAIDNRDGDLTPYVAIKGNIDESTPKIYTLQYKVSDKAGNFAFKIRTVTVVEQ